MFPLAQRINDTLGISRISGQAFPQRIAKDADSVPFSQTPRWVRQHHRRKTIPLQLKQGDIHPFYHFKHVTGMPCLPTAGADTGPHSGSALHHMLAGNCQPGWGDEKAGTACFLTFRVDLQEQQGLLNKGMGFGNCQVRAFGRLRVIFYQQACGQGNKRCLHWPLWPL